MKKLFWAGLLLCIGLLSACIEYDESTLMADDAGYMHRTIHYTKDKRGRNYFPEKISATGERRFVFDPKVSAWAAYDEAGNRLLTGGGSAGVDVCEENPNQSCRTMTGTFRVYSKRGLDCRSGEYPVNTNGGAKMPYCTYFYQGYTIHAAFEVPERPSSHGCVRIFPSAAKWLSENFFRIGTKVIILGYPDNNGVNKSYAPNPIVQRIQSLL